MTNTNRTLFLLGKLGQTMIRNKKKVNEHRLLCVKRMSQNINDTDLLANTNQEFTLVRRSHCLPVMSQESEDPAVVDDLLSDVPVLEATALHPVKVEGQHAVREAHCRHRGVRAHVITATLYIIVCIHSSIYLILKL